MIHVKVRINHLNKNLPFIVIVTGAGHTLDCVMECVNMSVAWAAAREVSEKEQDYRVANGPGWK